MKAFVITTSNKREENFMETLLSKLSLQSSQMSAAEVEEYGLIQLMKQADRNKKVSRSSVMKKLKS
jgi:hypothetical protein